LLQASAQEQSVQLAPLRGLASQALAQEQAVQSAQPQGSAVQVLAQEQAPDRQALSC